MFQNPFEDSAIHGIVFNHVLGVEQFVGGGQGVFVGRSVGWFDFGNGRFPHPRHSAIISPLDIANR